MALSSNQIKLIRQLHLKKHRAIAKEFIVEGEKLVEELIASDWEVSAVYSTDDNYSSSGAQPIFISEKDMSRISMLKSPSNLLAIAKQKEWNKIDDPKKLLVLDGINDPGNLGTIIRTADWFGFEGIICSENTVELYNPKVLQSTMGSIFRMPIIYESLPKMLKNYHEKGVKSIVTHLDGDENMPTALDAYMLVMGSESHGVSAKVAAMATHKVKIPGFGNAESLNVGVATGIMCYALTK